MSVSIDVHLDSGFDVTVRTFPEDSTTAGFKTIKFANGETEVNLYVKPENYAYLNQVLTELAAQVRGEGSDD